MRIAIYARVSTESQEARGTIGSQLDVLRKRVAAEGHEQVAEYCDDGWSGARLDRPGLDALRDAAEAGRLDAVWCLSPDRLARMYAYQVIVLDELAHHGVTVLFHDTPPLADDPQAQLLTQVQGVIAEYERAKIAERYRRGKLWRARAGEVIAWKCSYGYRRIARSAERAAHLEIYEPEAMIVRRIFRDYVESNLSMRQISWQLNQDLVPSPSGKAVWGVSMIGRLIRNEAYVGRAYYNRTASVLDRHRTKAKRQISAPVTSGSPYQFPRSSTRNSSRRRNASAMTTPNGALGVRNQITGSCAGSSSAATVALACRVTRCAVAMGPSTITTIAAITTLSGLEGSIGNARSATFEPANSTRSSSIRSVPPCCDRTCFWPARLRYQRGGKQEATSCLPPSLPVSTGRSTPSPLSAAVWPISIKRVSSSAKSSNAAARNWNYEAARSTRSGRR